MTLYPRHLTSLVTAPGFIRRCWAVLGLSLVILMVSQGALKAQETNPMSATLQSVLAEMQGGLTLPVVVAIKEVMEEALTSTLVDTVYLYFEPAMAAFILLAVVVFGIKMATGGTRHPLSEAAFLAIKVALVVEFTGNMEYWMNILFDITDNLMSMVVAALTGSYFTSGTADGLAQAFGGRVCQAAEGLPEPPAPQYLIWHQIDCMLVNFMGFSAAGSIFSALFGFFTSMVFSGYLGIYITTTGISAFIGFLFAILRVAYMYVASLMAIAFLIVLAPMFIPLVLFKATNRFFEKWLQQLISFTLQPVIMAAFVVFMIKTYDLVLFTSETISISVALTGEPTTPDEFDLTQFMENINTYFQSSGITTGPIFENPESLGGPDAQLAVFNSTIGGQVAPTGDTATGARAQDFLQDPLASMGFSMNVDAFNPTVFPGMEGIDDDYLRNIELTAPLERILVAFTMLGLVSLMMYTMLTILEQMIQNLVNRPWRLDMSYELPGEKNFQDGMDAFRQTAIGQSSVLPGFMPSMDGRTIYTDGQGMYYYGTAPAEAGHREADPMDLTLRSYMSGMESGMNALTPFNLGGLIGEAMSDNSRDTTSGGSGG